MGCLIKQRPLHKSLWSINDIWKLDGLMCDFYMYMYLQHSIQAVVPLLNMAEQSPQQKPGVRFNNFLI